MRPFGSWRDNFHAALIAKTIADVNRAPNSKPIPINGFFYRDAVAIEEERKERDRLMFERISRMADGQ